MSWWKRLIDKAKKALGLTGGGNGCQHRNRWNDFLPPPCHEPYDRTHDQNRRHRFDGRDPNRVGIADGSQKGVSTSVDDRRKQPAQRTHHVRIEQSRPSNVGFRSAKAPIFAQRKATLIGGGNFFRAGQVHARL